jgi:transcriptional regulator with GAF, ATPase, and Fis domain
MSSGNAVPAARDRDDERALWWEGVGAPGKADALLAALRAAGVPCRPAAGDSEGSGLLLFDRAGPEVCARLHERAHGGNDRVVAVATQPIARGAAWELLDAGAADVVELGDVEATAAAIGSRVERWAAVDRLLERPLVRSNLIGGNAAWRGLLRRVVEVAKFSSLPILIHGESGTGKELVARLIHTLDGRAEKKELVVLDCTTVVPELSGSEFFGHERGAYTGAAGARDGAFALANGGTLFLDEVGELPLRLQAELLRVVQEGTYKRVGGNTWEKTSFRLVCATHRDLGEDVRQGRFRRDFYYRIAAWICTLPPLRERREDIVPLARHFLQTHFKIESAPPLDPAVLDLLVSRDYPGNVRDLRHLVERIAYRHVGNGPITVADVPEEERPTASGTTAGWRTDELFEQAGRVALLCGMGLKEIASTATDASIRLALAQEGGNVGRAAELLGVTDRAIQKRRATWRTKDAATTLADID